MYVYIYKTERDLFVCVFEGERERERLVSTAAKNFEICKQAIYWMGKTNLEQINFSKWC